MSNKNIRKKVASKAKTIKRPGSGRTKGSFSFVKLTVADLCSKFKDNAIVVVSRKWAEANGFENLKTTNAANLFGSIEGTTAATRVAATVVNLDEEETTTPETPEAPTPTGPVEEDAAPVAVTTINLDETEEASSPEQTQTQNA